MRFPIFLFLLFWGYNALAQIDPTLLAVAQANDLNAVKKINPTPAMLNAQDKHGATALMWAAYKGDLAMVRYMLEGGANPMLDGAICLDDTCGGYYGNLLGIAAGEGKMDMLRYFVEELNIPVDDVEWNPITKKKDGWTALTWACSRNVTVAALYLLEKNANPKINLWQPLESAIINGNDTISTILLRYYHKSDSVSPDLIVSAARFGLDSIVNYLLSIRQDQNDYSAALSYYLLAERAKEALAFEKAYKYYERFYSEVKQQGESENYEWLGRGVKNMADIKFRLNEYESADSLSQIWLNNSRQQLGDTSESYAVRLREYADSLMENSLYKKAEKPFRELVEIWKKREGCNRCYAISLNNVGWNLNNQGRYQEAEPYLLESLAIWKKLGKKEEDEIYVVLWNLGTTLVNLEKHAEAEMIWLERLAMAKTIFGENSIETGVALNDLGWMCRRKKDYPKALRYLRESLKLGDKNIADYVTTCINLANTYEDLGDTPSSLNVKLTLIDTLLKYNNWEYRKARLCEDVGGFYSKLKKYDEAIAYYRKALEFQARITPKTDYWYYSIFDDIGLCFYKKKDFVNARLCWEEESKYDTSKVIRLNFARLEKAEGNFSIASNLYNKHFEIFFNIQENFKGSKISYKHWYYENIWKNFFDEIVSLSAIFNSDSTNMLAFNAALRGKNIILEESKKIKYFVKLSNNQVFQDSLMQLAKAQKEYANVYIFQPTDNDGEIEKTLRKKIETIQSYLSEVYHKDNPNIGKSYGIFWQDIQSALSPSETAIEFVDFKFHHTDWTDSTLYAAIVIRPGWNAPRFVTLFEAGDLSALMDDRQERGAAYAEKLYPAVGRAHPVGSRNISLHQLIWGKLDSLLQGVKTVYFSPSGYLNRLNLGAIANPNKQIAAERYQLVQMASTRQLLQRQTKTVPNRTAALFGGLQYNADSLSISLAAAKFRDTKGPKMRSDMDMMGVTAQPMDTLAFTRAEIQGTMPILKKNKYKVVALTGFDGTEEALYQICQTGKSPGILHLATHGFFFSDPLKDSLASERSVPFALSNSAMLRSGIVFSGCNRMWTTGKPYPGLHDGVLTAYEAAQLDLANTELVTLSACETALGDLNVEGGVFGLQRAFIQAGAHYVIMSLWKVDDSTTKDFMIAFYQKWLEGQKTIPEAFRETQLEMRKKHPNPYFWAPFILVE